MRLNGLISLFAAAVIFMLSGCTGFYEADVYDVTVDPYRPVNEDDICFGECQITFGDGVSVTGQGAWYKDNDIIISKGGIYKLTGSYSGGRINVTTTDAVKLVFANADISSDDGYAVVSSAERLILASDGENTLTGCGGDLKNAVYSDGSVLVEGSGAMCIDGGIFSRGKINFGREIAVRCDILSTDSGETIVGVLNIQ